MKWKSWLAYVLSWGLWGNLWGQNSQVTLCIPSSNLPESATNQLYVAGNFNQWNPKRTDCRLKPDKTGNYSVTIDSLKEGQILEYKFTRGDWESVETQPDGTFINNRTFIVHNGATATHSIGNWNDMTNPTVSNTPTGNVRVLHSEFFIPELDRKRRIWIYLPPDYAVTTQKYPVIYMQDGQNLFDNTTSFSGEWGLDESMEQLFAGGDKGAIIVGIDNGGITRLDEYSPWINTQYGGGEGEKYISFLIHTLKPHIDSTFRTLTDRENTAIGGSSMGGLISLYAGIEHQDIFSKIMVFSPSLWFSEEAYIQVETQKRQFPMRIYLMCGTPEGNGSVETDIKRMLDTLLSAGFAADELKLVTKADGQHSEWFWKREYSDAYLWLFESDTTAVSYSVDESIPFIVSPTPFTKKVTLIWKSPVGAYSVALFNSSGQNVYIEKKKGNHEIDTQALPKGGYLLIVEVNGRVFRKKVLKG